MPANKVKISFEESRKALLKGLTAQVKGKVITKIIPFTNDDVPKFLHKLDKFEARSRKTCLMVGEINV